MSDEQAYRAGCNRCKVLEDALRLLWEDVTREWGEQPGVTSWLAARDVLAALDKERGK